MTGRLHLLILVVISTLQWSKGSHHEPNFKPGRTTIVHLFEWKWNDIADECEVFLGPYGYGGVQVSPPNENGIVWQPFWNNNIKRPWYERYQPVSYKLITRSGDEMQFTEMVRRCNNAGVRVYVDTVINHMTGEIGAGTGTGGSYFDPSVPKYDGVPYRREHFNSKDKCPTSSGDIEDYNNKRTVKNCQLSGLKDLDLGQEYVRNKIAEYMNKLIAIGVARIPDRRSKHMWPHDLSAIYNRLNNLNSVFFGDGKKAFIYQEVIDMGGEAIKADEYVNFGRVTEFRYGKHLGDVIRKNHNQQLKFLRNFGEGWSFVAGSNALTFVDNHDNQRGHGAGGYGSILTHRNSKMYKMAVAFMLAWPYGLPRVMSSFSWPENIVNGKDQNDWIGPPHDENYNIKNVPRHSDLTCGDGWVCEHRWRQIYNMVKFRNVAGFDTVQNWWDNGYHQIAFSRGNKGFIVINNENHALNQSLKTGLPEGTYCDVISGNKDGNRCTGKSITVNSSGYAQIHVDNAWSDPMIAIHVQAKL
ncbi:LOW QUALITY PROTEIN: pancreatic alpha-amylase-like [Uloborus diversus]|uniref:LOW QUALITY PROTEIN: pancreatic alpha-amylase-like n=1 Tax=Uloborus diversus TaxID=327109 RepID=UPI0024093874|nr:LOW QUALITY PROTEIN: pancreatic alpha-amylase-like [Uloborus diversus]